MFSVVCLVQHLLEGLKTAGYVGGVMEGPKPCCGGPAPSPGTLLLCVQPTGSCELFASATFTKSA